MPKNVTGNNIVFKVKMNRNVTGFVLVTAPSRVVHLTVTMIVLLPSASVQTLTFSVTLVAVFQCRQCVIWSGTVRMPLMNCIVEISARKDKLNALITLVVCKMIKFVME
jgi:hypothetical protein